MSPLSSSAAELVEHRVENERKEAAVRGEALRATLEPLKDMDWRTLMAASSGEINAKVLVAMAFQDGEERRKDRAVEHLTGSAEHLALDGRKAIGHGSLAAKDCGRDASQRVWKAWWRRWATRRAAKFHLKQAVVHRTAVPPQ